MGRPSDFTAEMANTICERIADGESLRQICTGEDMPGRSTVRQWLAKYPEFARQYAHARDQQADVMAERIIDAARALGVGWTFEDISVRSALAA